MLVDSLVVRLFALSLSLFLFLARSFDSRGKLRAGKGKKSSLTFVGWLALAR